MAESFFAIEEGVGSLAELSDMVQGAIRRLGLYKPCAPGVSIEDGVDRARSRSLDHQRSG